MPSNAGLILGLALNAFGHDPAAWRAPGAASSRALDGFAFADLARTAEAGGLDFLSVGYPFHGTALAAPDSDQAIQLDPLSLAAALIASTARIGLCAAVSTTYWAPFNIARAFSTLDNLSLGRAGWLVDAALRRPDLENVGARFEPRAVAARNTEFLEVAFKLWDSWEDDAIVLDRPNARFTDAAKVHRINHSGAHFTVEGPLNAPRPVQGRPPVIMTDQTPSGLALAARFADVLIIRARAPDEALALRRALRNEGTDRAIRILVDIRVSLETDATGLADLMEAWLTSGACDGFHLLPAVLPDGLHGVVQDLVPNLRRRGLVRDHYEGATLRDHLRLPRPASRYSVVG